MKKIFKNNENIKKLNNKMVCKNFLDIFDIYSIEYKLRYKGNKNYNSLLGKIIGGLSIILFISLFINFSIEFIQKKTFDLIYFSSMNINYNINLTNIPFFFSLVDDYGNFIPFKEHLFNFKFQYINQFYSNNTIPKTDTLIYDLEFCEEIYNINEFSFYLKEYPNYNLSDFLCFPKNLELNLKGRIGINNTSIRLIISKNNSNLNYSIINYININGINLVITFLSDYIDHYSYEQPIKHRLRAELFPISLINLKKNFFFYFQGVSYKTNKGLLFDSFYEKNYFEPQKISFDIEKLEQNNEILSTISFYCSDFYSFYIRKYKTIQFYLSLFGGFCQVIYNFVNIFTHYILSKMSYKEIINEIYFNIFNKKSNNNYNKSNSQYFTSQNKFIICRNNKIFNKNNSSNEKKYSNKQSQLNHIITYDNDNNNNNNNNNSIYTKIKPISFNCFYYFLPFVLLKKNKTILLYQKLKNSITKKISIDEIFFYEITKNKKIIINKALSNEIINYF